MWLCGALNEWIFVYGLQQGPEQSTVEVFSVFNTQITVPTKLLIG